MNRSHEKLSRSLAGENSVNYFNSLYRPAPKVYEYIGIYSQLAATLDFHLRRLYFGLKASGDNERGPERAQLMNLFDRFPDAIGKSKVELKKSDRFLRLIEIIRNLLKMRNQVIHATCRWQPDGDVLVFAHVNENVGDDIRTGEKVSYWAIEWVHFQRIVQDLEKMCKYINQYMVRWLPKVRPWLSSSFNGEPDPNGERAEAFLDDMEARSAPVAPDDA